MTTSRPKHASTAFAAAVALAFALLLALPAAAGATSGLPADFNCGSVPPVYMLLTFNGVRCPTAEAVSFGLAYRFDRTSRFRGKNSRVRITQRDTLRRTWRCRWQSADIHNNVILWACKRNAGVVTWVWRADD